MGERVFIFLDSEAHPTSVGLDYAYMVPITLFLSLSTLSVLTPLSLSGERNTSGIFLLSY